MTSRFASVALLAFLSGCGGSATETLNDSQRTSAEESGASTGGDSSAGSSAGGANLPASGPAGLALSMGGSASFDRALGCSTERADQTPPAFIDAELPLCGDGRLDEKEVCDDEVDATNGACWDNCLGLDNGYICACAGEACFPYSVCGNGTLEFPEQCDDGNGQDGDGCSALCLTEGSTCEDGYPESCTPVCGNGSLELGEQCDNAELNVGGYNRCGTDCQLSEFCGDGIVQENEFCDDASPNAPANCINCWVINLR